MTETAPQGSTLPNVSATSNGIIVGTEPPRATQHQFVPQPPHTQTAPVATPQGQFFTADQLATARQQEKDKLYPQLDELRTKLETLQKEREERLAEQEELRRKAEADAEEKRKSELTLKERLAQIEKETEEKFRSLDEERERERALLDKERQMLALQEYRARRLNEERENILPELIDLISGNTEEQIEASITGLRDRTSRILEGARQALAPQTPLSGARVTAPPAGPLDTNSENRLPTPDEIRAMDINEYQKYRDRLLGSTSGARNRGLFG